MSNEPNSTSPNGPRGETVSPDETVAPGPPPIPVTPEPPRVAGLAGTAASRAAGTAPKKQQSKPHHHQDGFRELIETIVFVVVLVLILKTFLAEAFVIPTGSMATTLLGYHRDVTCEQCGHRFLVNASSEADPGERHPQPVTAAYCENCQHLNRFRPQLGQGGFRGP